MPFTPNPGNKLTLSTGGAATLTRFLLCALTLFLACSSTQADQPDVAQQFLEANRLYEQGHYSQAAQAYQAILATGKASAAVHFNLGNALFRAGELGRAIAQYRQAQALAPRDPDIRANLGFARQQVAGTSSVAPPPWVQKLSELRLREWIGLTLAGCWVTFALLTLGQWRPTLRRRLRLWALLAALFTLAHLTATIALWHRLHQAPLAVVLNRDTPVHYGPLPESQVFFTPYEGSELIVEDQQDTWVQVTDAAQRTGWIRRHALWIPKQPALHGSAAQVDRGPAS